MPLRYSRPANRCESQDYRFREIYFHPQTDSGKTFTRFVFDGRGSGV